MSALKMYVIIIRVYGEGGGRNREREGGREKQGERGKEEKDSLFTRVIVKRVCIVLHSATENRQSGRQTETERMRDRQTETDRQR